MSSVQEPRGEAVLGQHGPLVLAIIRRVLPPRLEDTSLPHHLQRPWYLRPHLLQCSASTVIRYSFIENHLCGEFLSRQVIVADGSAALSLRRPLSRPVAETR